MIIYKEKLQIQLDEDISQLEEEIRQLEKLKEKILDSAVFKVLDGKTQMVYDKKRPNVRSRQDHTVNVANIAKRIIGRIYDSCSIEQISATECFKLNKKRAELYAEIMGLSHDLGHTTFSHTGEEVVNEFLRKINDPNVIARIIEHRKNVFRRRIRRKSRPYRWI